jgi:nucleotide-binding universal stress UspA family protein
MMKMAQEKVLVLIDDTLSSERVAAFAVKLLKANPALGATLLFVGNHQKVLPSVPGAGWVSHQEFVELVEKEAEAVFQKALAVFRTEGFGVHSLLVYGEPAEVITRLVEEEGYGLVVLSGEGTGDRVHYVLSSTVYRLSHLLDMPLVVVK